MADSLTTEQRSERMRRVRQKDTALEVLVRKELHRRGLRYRLGGCRLPRRPDLVFPRHRAIVFVEALRRFAKHMNEQRATQGGTQVHPSAPRSTASRPITSTGSGMFL